MREYKVRYTVHARYSLRVCQHINHSTLCLKKNDNDVVRYNFNAHQPILIIFGRDIAEQISY